ncbi:MAG: hypothetical protein HKN70_14030 [Gammaproteobacteria bacterium]|nr:hypothetical protein [Gammaproteobacteria bacterium]
MKKYTLLTTIILVLQLSACGGGGSGNAVIDVPNIPPVAGISRTVITAGTISTFGSIVVNGVRITTTNASFDIDGQPGTQSDLKVGQFVIVKARFNDDLMSGDATEVIFDDSVTGVIELIDATQQRLVVLGQTVFTNASTSFDDTIPGSALSGLAVGNSVEVSGLVNADGAITATRIELKPAGTEFEVTGLVANLDTAARSFSINELTINYSSAQLDDFPAGMIENGQNVEVNGLSLDADGALVATSVEFKGNLFTGDDGDRIEIEGFVTRFVSASDFDVAGVPVTTDGATLFEGGDATDLGLNVKVEVEGDFNADGTVVATEVDIRRAKAVRVTALVDTVNAAANSLVMLGITVNIDALTRLEDKSDADLDPLTISDLASGDYLEVRGAENPPGSAAVLAAIVERDDSDDETELQGFVTSISEPAITVLGVTIETGSAVFRNASDTIISRADFFNQIGVNSLIKASGTETARQVISADEVEIEIED